MRIIVTACVIQRPSPVANRANVTILQVQPVAVLTFLPDGLYPPSVGIDAVDLCVRIVEKPFGRASDTIFTLELEA